MHTCSFRYKERVKHYFVDSHERPETIAYRPVFTKIYLGFEILAHRWLQITLEESDALLLEGHIAAQCGFNYIADGIDMVEYHSDPSYAFEERLALFPFGGNLVSIQKSIDSKTVIFVGQDEAIFKQFLFLTKRWVGPSGKQPLLPKDERTGTMISTFICRGYGLIRDISPQILAEVNLQRAGEQHEDEEAEIEMYSSPADKKTTYL
jgi:hypothetical protein